MLFGHDTTDHVQQIIRKYSHSNLIIELDLSQVYPDDPGAGTPAMVYLDTSKGRHSATYWCAIGEGEVENNRTSEMHQLTDKQVAWLDDQQDKIEAFLEQHWLYKVYDAAFRAFPWIVGLSRPSRVSVQYNMEGDYFAISGDGLLSSLWKIENLGGDNAGLVTYTNLYEAVPKEKLYPPNNNWKPGEAYPSIQGRMLHDRGVKHGDQMTFPEVIQHVREMGEARRRA